MVTWVLQQRYAQTTSNWPARYLGGSCRLVAAHCANPKSQPKSRQKCAPSLRIPANRAASAQLFGHQRVCGALAARLCGSGGKQPAPTLDSRDELAQRAKDTQAGQPANPPSCAPLATFGCGRLQPERRTPNAEGRSLAVRPPRPAERGRKHRRRYMRNHADLVGTGSHMAMHQRRSSRRALCKRAPCSPLTKPKSAARNAANMKSQASETNCYADIDHVNAVSRGASPRCRL